MVPIPTKPILVAVITVPPIPTFSAFPAVKMPVTLSKVNNEEVPNSLLLLNNNCWLLPGENTVIVTPIPGEPSAYTYPFALIAAPTKLTCVILLTPAFVGTITPSSYTVIAPGIKPPLTGIQNLFPGDPRTDITWYCCPIGSVCTITDGSPRFGSACSNPRYSYLSSVKSVCDVLSTLPLKYFLGIIMRQYYFLKYYK